LQITSLSTNVIQGPIANSNWKVDKIRLEVGT